MMRYVLTCISLLALCLNVSAEGQLWVNHFDTEVDLGEADSRVTARANGLEKIKLLAANEVGTYVETSVNLQGNEVSETVKTLGASMVKLTEVHDEVLIKPGNKVVLYISATATVDESELRTRIKALQIDKDKEARIQVLSKENQSLQEELKRIHKDMLSTKDPLTIANLVTQQDTTLKQVSGNDRAVSNIFKEGTLLVMANKNSVALDNAKRDIERNVLVPLLNTRLNAEIENVVKKGGLATIRLRLSWSAPASVEAWIRKYFTHRVGRNDNIEILSYNNKVENARTSVSVELLAWLKGQKILGEIQVGKKTITIPVSISCEPDPWKTVVHLNKRSSDYCIVNKQNSTAKSLLSDSDGLDSLKRNPIDITIPISEAAKVNQIETRMVRR